MKAEFFERNGVLVVSVETDGSTRTEVKATDEHKAKFNAAYRAFLATKEPKQEEKPKPKRTSKAKS